MTLSASSNNHCLAPSGLMAAGTAEPFVVCGWDSRVGFRLASARWLCFYSALPAPVAVTRHSARCIVLLTRLKCLRSRPPASSYLHACRRAARSGLGSCRSLLVQSAPLPVWATGLPSGGCITQSAPHLNPSFLAGMTVYLCSPYVEAPLLQRWMFLCIHRIHLTRAPQLHTEG